MKEHMCNPAASLSSFNLDSLDADDVNPVNVKTEDDYNHPISCSMASTLPYNAGSPEEVSRNGLNNTMDHDYSPKNTMDDDYKLPSQPSNSCQFNQNASLDENNDTKYPLGSLAVDNAMSPIDAMSPLGAMSPTNDYDDDGSNLPPLPSLDNIFGDFDFKTKPLPPPKRKLESEDSTPPANDASSIVSVPTAPTERSPIAPTVRSPIASTVHSPINSTVRSPIDSTVRLPIASNARSSIVPPIRETVDPPVRRDVSPPVRRAVSPLVATFTERTITRPTAHSASTSAAAGAMDQEYDTTNAIDTDDVTANTAPNSTSNDADQPIPKGRYSKIVYAPLVVNPSPQNRTVWSNGVNFKKFKKVCLFFFYCLQSPNAYI
ncbi:hypothetical protein HPULCUR_003700 [Helicostylum pulchrum]|uniref:Uncharacterized protein n=1 Tax=Helicostylum pulchrum TaxID=562976 RepID=A0ABP9XU36_9FUNG